MDNSITDKERKMMEEYQQKSARKLAEDYFENVLYSLRSAIEEVERNRNHWREAMEGGSYPDGSPLGDDLKVNEIIWTANYLQQLNVRHEQATRVTAKLAQAFNVYL